MAIQYLFDENVDPAYANQIRRRNPNVFVLAVGELTAPAQGTLDPEILIWCETHNFILVTNNRRSMPVYLADYLEQNRHIPGIFILNSKMSIGQNIDELILIYQGSFDDEYQDRIEHLPL
ncbi:MAG: DUF5615 family PIN-like protein [Microcoleus sp. CSU_2_2]|nr:DUF5615 family PIN-like protein [Microcoleus sp. SU_5_3]NJS09055.1 DUF5615 family PIN-like protein [Microcoleus sp. CSU_2_2]